MQVFSVEFDLAALIMKFILNKEETELIIW